MPGASISLSATVSGPLFEHGGKHIKSAIQKGLQRLVERGEQKLDTMARSRDGGGVFLSASEAKRGQATKGNYRLNIGGVVKNMVGRIDDGGVEYGPWLEGTDSRNQSTRFKGYHMFRKTATQLRKDAKSVMNAAVKVGVDRTN
jgi:hypothetical protein